MTGRPATPRPATARRAAGPALWKDVQLLVIRLYIGFDFLGHFPEKLGLLGPDAHRAVLAYFVATVPHPRQMLLLAGLCELGACVGLGLGLLTRPAALGSALYLLISLFAGHHDRIGFTWAKPGGGWEFAALWACVCASFVLTGGGRWSLDRPLRARLPRGLRWLAA